MFFSEGGPLFMTTVRKEIITLEFYKPEYSEKLEYYHLSKEQKKYTALPSEALLACERDEERYPVVILYNQTPAGFFVLHEGKGVEPYSENTHAVLLRAYSIHEHLQGREIAKTSIKLLPLFVKENFPDKNEIILAVNHLNKAAQHVYQAGGFKDHGVRSMGMNGEQFIFQMKL